MGSRAGLSRAWRPIWREAQEKHVWARVHGAQRAINLKAVHARLDIKALRNHDLKSISCADVVLGPRHCGREVLFRGAVLHLELAVPLWLSALQGWQRLRQPFLQLVEALDGAIVDGRGIAVSYVRCHHQPDLLAHMIKSQHLIKKQQAGVWDSELIFRQCGQAFDLAHSVIGKKAHGAGSKWWQSRQPGWFVATQRVAQHSEDVAFNVRRFRSRGAQTPVIAIWRPRATMRLKGVRPMNVYRPTCSPPSTDSSRKHSRSGHAARRKAETGVSRSAVRVRQTGTRVCVRARARNSLRLGKN